MFWLLAIAAAVSLGVPVLVAVLIAWGARRVWKRLAGRSRDERPTLDGRTVASLPTTSRDGCPREERAILRSMEKRLETAHQQSREAMDRRLASEVARARISGPLEDAYVQIKGEIESIYAFCARNDLAGTLKKARRTAAAQDIYQAAYERDLAKVKTAIDKTEECLAAYERTVATLEVSSVEADISSDFDASIEMLRDLREELPLYSLEDRV